MTIQEHDLLEGGTATRIRRIREAFAESDAPEELMSGFDEDIFDEIVP